RKARDHAPPKRVTNLVFMGPNPERRIDLSQLGQGFAPDHLIAIKAQIVAASYAELVLKDHDDAASNSDVGRGGFAPDGTALGRDDPEQRLVCQRRGRGPPGKRARPGG